MYKYRRTTNKFGVTLVELLLVLSIGSMITAIIFSVLHTGLKTYKIAESKQLLQQEANIMLIQLRTIHSKQTTYRISYDSNDNIFKVDFPDGSSQQIGNSKFQTELKINSTLIDNTSSFTVTSAVKHFELYLKLSDTNTNQKVAIKTGITRL